ncbi:MAG: hypothetical protein CM1200mP41_22880 [Gammaproteobacteria bacterium]|nr:MAG: hypothetical protein CM1200mP41_22880 [Gammaproteobacteria bacterium]
MVNRIQDFEIVPSDQALGAEVRGVDLAQPLSGDLYIESSERGSDIMLFFFGPVYYRRAAT